MTDSSEKVILTSKANGGLDSRDAFERYWREYGGLLHRHPRNSNLYDSHGTAMAWAAWQRTFPVNTHETCDGPTPHHVQYDKTGWLCSICGGWNRDTWTRCSHPHTQKALEQSKDYTK